jgi:signal recognition particle subunit SRP54
MGDVLSLIEKAEEAFEAEQAEVAAQRLMDGTFTFDDFLEQMNAIKKMGPLSNIMSMLPGIPKEVRDVEIDDKEVGRIEGDHPLDDGRAVNPDIIDTSRRQRIANGSGSSARPTSTQLVTQFKEMRKMMQQMGGGAMKRVKKKTKKGKSEARASKRQRERPDHAEGHPPAS